MSARLLAALATRLGWRRPKWALAPLDGWAAWHTDPDAGVWSLTPPCGHGWWRLWAPGSPDPDVDFPYEDREPYARHPARDGADDLPAIYGWLVPWVEQVTGGRVVDLVQGWSPPYGPARDLREYVIYARVVTR